MLSLALKQKMQSLNVKTKLQGTRILNTESSQKESKETFKVMFENNLTDSIENAAISIP